MANKSYKTKQEMEREMLAYSITIDNHDAETANFVGIQAGLSEALNKSEAEVMELRIALGKSKSSVSSGKYRNKKLSIKLRKANRVLKELDDTSDDLRIRLDRVTIQRNACAHRESEYKDIIEGLKLSIVNLKDAIITSSLWDRVFKLKSLIKSIK